LKVSHSLSSFALLLKIIYISPRRLPFLFVVIIITKIGVLLLLNDYNDERASGKEKEIVCGVVCGWVEKKFHFAKVAVSLSLSEAVLSRVNKVYQQE
jgi:hypothetical protein